MIGWQKANTRHFECVDQERLGGTVEFVAAAFEIADRAP
jgi:hypothetical protein